MQTINEIFGELASLVTAFAVAGATLDGSAHLNHSWIYWVLGCLVFAGVGMVVENAANGPIRFARAIAALHGELDAKIGKLENSIEEIRRVLKEQS